MKTQTKNSNTRNRNFFQKTFILLAILAFTSFGFKAKAQNNAIDIDNQSSCTWVIKACDGSSTQIGFTISIPPGQHNVYCRNGATLNYIEVQDAGAGCTKITFGSGFPHTIVTPSCGVPPCSTSIDCSGGGPTTLCGGGLGSQFVILIIY